MSIVKYKNQSGVTYAYEQTSVYDAEKKQSRPIRKYLGRVDPETGEIISTKGKRGRPPKQAAKEGGPDSPSDDYKTLYEEKCAELGSVRRELLEMTAQKDRLELQVRGLRDVLDTIRAKLETVNDL